MKIENSILINFPADKVFIRTGPLGRWLNRKEFAAVSQHQKEECENLKSIVENS